MPFKSEKQRRYLWANEPEIARDWADTYGSRIKKKNGGITNTVTVPKHWQSAPDHPKTELAYITKPEKNLLVKKDLHNSLKDGPNTGPGGVMSLNGDYSDMMSGITGADISAAERGEGPRGAMDQARADELRAGFIAAGGGGGKPGKDDSPEVKKQFKEIKKASKKRKKDAKYALKAQKLKAKKKQAFINHLKKTWTANPHMDPEEVADMLEAQFNVSTNPDGTKSYDFTGDAITTGFQKGTKYNMPTDTQLGPFGLKDTNVKGEKLSTKYLDRTPDFSTIVTAPLLSKMIGLGTPNYNTLLSTFNRMNTLDDITTKEGWQGYWDDARKRHETVGGGDNQPLWMQQGYPSHAAWLAAQGGGGGGGGTTPPVDTGSDFQDSLTGTADTPDYYVGSNPLASNIAWGKQAGVDPRTMGIYNQNQYGFPTWAADGGRVPAAFGGIMDTTTGRRAYGLGSIFKKIGRAAKKVLKSDIGKAAIIAAGGYYLGGGGNPFTAAGRGGFSWANLKSAPFVKQLLTKEGAGLAWDPWKVGIGALSALPFFMGKPEDEDEDKGVDYDLLRDKYASELMNIKRGVMAGSLNPNEFSYLPSNYTYTGAEGGRAGYYAGGQSVPSDYTMEDARMTTTQDKLGGITEAMKRADLYRKGSVGQMYAADGGRIGYDAGGQTGYPPIIMGQIQAPPQMPAPQVPQTPMPAPQPNPMAMNPMMNRPMMNPMGGRVMAQEGGLMDLGGMEKDYRNDGGFVPIGGEEKADDVPARLSRNEFVFTADAVRGAGGGDIDKGAEIMENVMKNLEEGGQISEETQGLSGAQEMFGVSERLSEVI